MKISTLINFIFCFFLLLQPTILDSATIDAPSNFHRNRIANHTKAFRQQLFKAKIELFLEETDENPAKKKKKGTWIFLIVGAVVSIVCAISGLYFPAQLFGIMLLFIIPRLLNSKNKPTEEEHIKIKPQDSIKTEKENSKEPDTVEPNANAQLAKENKTQGLIKTDKKKSNLYQGLTGWKWAAWILGVLSFFLLTITYSPYFQSSTEFFITFSTIYGDSGNHLFNCLVYKSRKKI